MDKVFSLIERGVANDQPSSKLRSKGQRREKMVDQDEKNDD